MKYSTTVLVTLITVQFAFAQKSKESAGDSKSQQVSSANTDMVLKREVYKMALRYGDIAVAKHALYEMIVLNPTDKTLKDSLAMLYINAGMLRESILLSREILETAPENLPILEIKAVSEQNLGLSKEALQSYETLYSKTKNVFHLYQIATLQYELKRIAECNASIDQILASPDISEKTINLGTGQRGQLQKVALKAAALNVKGVLAMDLQEINVAKACFDEALKLTPDFVLAKNNVEFINQKNKSTSTTTPAKPTSPANSTKK